jgi:hypothetical protein
MRGLQRLDRLRQPQRDQPDEPGGVQAVGPGRALERPVLGGSETETTWLALVALCPGAFDPVDTLTKRNDSVLAEPPIF